LKRKGGKPYLGKIIWPIPPGIKKEIIKKEPRKKRRSLGNPIFLRDSSNFWRKKSLEIPKI